MSDSSNPLRHVRTTAVVCGVIGAVALVGLVDCTLVTSETNGQCHSDSDCRSRGAPFANTRCSAVGICEVVTVPELKSDAGVSCKTNGECNALLSGPARCFNNTCVSLTNASCTTVTGDATAADVMFVGVMTPRSGANAQLGLNQYDVVTTAAAEWNANIAGQANTRPVVTVGCDEMLDPGGTSTFLATKLGVSAIFGPVFDANFAKATSAATLNGAILVGPRADDPSMSSISGIGKTIWSWAPNRAIQVRFLNNLISTITPSVKTSQAVSGDIKLALVVATGDDTSSANFATSVESTLSFNGKSKDANGANYKRIDVPFSFSTANKYADTVAELVAAAPDLVIVTQEYDLAAFALAVNNGWTGPKFPRFVFFTEDPSVDSAVVLPNQKFAGKLDFVTWTRSAQELQNAATFKVAYHTATSADPLPFSESFYDAFYANAYAMQVVLASNGNSLATLDPGAYSNALLALNAPGSPLNVGPGNGTPSNIATALAAIASKSDLDLDGASGPLEMDRSAGSPIQNAELRCIKAAATSPTSSGVTFDGKTGAVSGSYSCL